MKIENDFRYELISSLAVSVSCQASNLRKNKDFDGKNKAVFFLYEYECVYLCDVFK